MSNLSAYMIQSGIMAGQQQPQQLNNQGEAGVAELSSLPNLLVESGDLTQGELVFPRFFLDISYLGNHYGTRM